MTIKICGDDVHAPLDFLDAFDNAKGFNTSITKAIANKINEDVEIELMPWTEAIERFENGEFDAIQGMSMGKDRMSKYYFCEEYITAFHCIFVLKERTDIDKDADLNNYKIAVQENDVGLQLAMERMDKENHKNIHIMKDQEKVLEALHKKEVDIAICNKLIATYFSGKLNIESEIRQIGNPINITKYSIAFKKENKELGMKFNEGLKTIKAKGSYERIYNIWFGNRENLMEKQIAQNVKVGIIYIDKLGRVNAINEFASEVMNVCADDIIYKIFYETDIIEVFSIDIIQEMLDGMRNPYSTTMTIKQKDGEDLRFDVSYSPICSESEETQGVIINFEDITEKEILKKSLMQKNRLEPLGQLLLNVAHEIRNPLACIKGFIDLLPENYDDDEFKESLMNHVPMQIEYINRLLTELLEYSKPVDAISSEINIKDFIEIQVIPGLLYGKAKDKNIEFDLDIESDFMLLIDFDQMNKILTNVIINAIDASEEGASIHIYTKETCSYKFICVENDGENIDEDFMEKIYDPFTTKKEKGTGLGLFISYHLMNENHGYIDIENTETGVRVSLVFPNNELTESRDVGGQSINSR